MLAASDKWDSISLAGAFLLGAVLATVAVLRIVRAVMVLYEEGPVPRRRRGRKRLPDNKENDDAG